MRREVAVIIERDSAGGCPEEEVTEFIGIHRMTADV